MNPLDSFRAVRWLRTLNLVLQAVLVLSFFAGLNYVAKNHAWRFDLTQHHKFSLSPETLAYVKNLERPVHIIVTQSPDTDNPEVRGLIDEYVYATEDRPAGKITKEVLDVYQNRRRSDELGIDQADLIVLLSGDKRRVVPMNELFTFKNKKRETFLGEQALSAAILDVSTLGRKKIYFVTGHGELRIDNTDAQTGLSSLRDQLKVRNFEVDVLDTTIQRKIPTDASVLVIVGPTGGFSRSEQEMLRQYLGASAGRVVLFLGPGRSAAQLGLEDLLLDWGVLVHNDLILDNVAANISDTNDLLIRHFMSHPITKTLMDYVSLPLRVGRARTVMPDPGRTLGGGLNVVTLAATSTTAWGERDFRPGQIPSYTPGVDTKAIPGMEPPDRLGVIVASERLAVRDNLPFSVRGGKMVVFGTADLLTNARMDLPALAIALSAVNWTVDRDRELNIPPRPIERFHLSLSASEFMRLRYTLLLVFPGSVMLLGLLVYWTRRA